MRWLILLTSFCTLIFVSFLIFIWNWRCELIAQAFELSLDNAPAKVESFTIHSLHFFDISHVTIQPKEQELLHIEKILLEVRFFDLLSWMCLPIRSPLVIEKATIAFQNSILLTKPDSKSKDLLIQEIEVITPDDRKLLLGEEKGSIGSILADILQLMDSEKPLQS